MLSSYCLDSILPKISFQILSTKTSKNWTFTNLLNYLNAARLHSPSETFLQRQRYEIDNKHNLEFFPRVAFTQGIKMTKRIFFEE